MADTVVEIRSVPRAQDDPHWVRVALTLTAVLIIAKLEEFAYAEATAIAVVLLVISFSMLIVINLLERWSRHE